jgi:hypothetical protein
MKRFGFLSAVSVICWIGTVPVAGHDCDHHNHYSDDCWDRGHHYQQNQRGASRQSLGSNISSGMLDLRTVEGKITEVVYLPGPAPESAMVEVRLQLGGQTTLVRLAPAGYLRKGDLRLREGETITIKGFPVAGLEGDLIVATEIHQGDKGMNLRDDQSKALTEYDPAREVVLKGIVQQVLRHCEEGQPGIHLIVSVGDRTVEVHLGPPHFLVWHQFRLQVGVKVEIVGAKARGQPHYLARSVKAGERTLDFRDERGMPLWR